MLSAAYIGYTNGDFLLVRRLRDPQLLQRFAAPAGTAFLVQSVSRGEGGVVQGEWRYYDRALNLLQLRPNPNTATTHARARGSPKPAHSAVPR